MSVLGESEAKASQLKVIGDRENEREDN